MTMTSSQDTLREALTAEGFRVEDTPGLGLSFRYEGSSDEDPQFFQLLPNFWSLETEDEYGRALLACGALNRHAKPVKVHTVKSDTWVSAEALQFLPRHLSYVRDTVRAFRDQMLFTSADDPTDDGALTTS